ncbi:MAG: hypothetical protein O2943_09825 [Actinomycetota bacterium]|nr:hypothetical protein [Actinomycetota bacterium]
MSISQQSGPATPRSNNHGWLPYALGAATFLVVLGTFGLIAGDWFVRNIETRTLVIAIENSESTMSQTQDSVSEAFDAFGGLDNPVAADREALVTELANVAGYAQLSIADAGDQVASVLVMPWHTNILEAQDAYVTHNLAWQSYMERAAKDPIEFTETQADVNDTFVAVEPALTDAIPQPALFDLVNRVAQIFIDGYPDPADETGGLTQDAGFESGAFASLLGHQIFFPMS